MNYLQPQAHIIAQQYIKKAHKKNEKIVHSYTFLE
jgi:hypothetical protein